jgi:hypothetical protein
VVNDWIPALLIAAPVGSIFAVGLLDFRRLPVQEYKEYSSADIIDRHWMNSDLIGLCGKCGCDDAPIVVHPYQGAQKCKWCAEFDNITYHLKMNGIRRLEKGRK